MLHEKGNDNMSLLEKYREYFKNVSVDDFIKDAEKNGISLVNVEDSPGWIDHATPMYGHFMPINITDDASRWHSLQNYTITTNAATGYFGVPDVVIFYANNNSREAA